MRKKEGHSSLNAESEIKKGFKWSFVGFFIQKSLTFVTGLILARLLSPADFGLLGMANVFLGIFMVLLDGGFGYTIIRSKELNDRLINSSLWFNVIASFSVFLLFNIAAPYIADFYNEPTLVDVIYLLSFIIIINSFRIVAFSVNVRNLQFKERAKIDIVSNVLAGIVGITMALNGYGVKSLIFQMITASIVGTIYNHYVANINYKFQVSWAEIKHIWNTSNKIFFNQILSAVFNNLNNLIIGRFFSVAALGYYTRARSFTSIAQTATIQLTQRSVFPVFAKMNDKIETRELARKTIKKLCLFSMPLILYLAAVSDNLVIFLLTEKWEQSIIYLKLLAIMISLYPPQMVYINVLQANNASSFFRSEVVSKISRVAFLFASIPFGIEGIIMGQIIHVLILNFISGYILSREIPYTILEQIRDYIPFWGFAMLQGLVIYLVGYFISQTSYIELIIQSFLFIIIFPLYLSIQGINVKQIFKKNGSNL